MSSAKIQSNVSPFATAKLFPRRGMKQSYSTALVINLSLFKIGCVVVRNREFWSIFKNYFFIGSFTSVKGI